MSLGTAYYRLKFKMNLDVLVTSVVKIQLLLLLLLFLLLVLVLVLVLVLLPQCGDKDQVGYVVEGEEDILFDCELPRCVCVVYVCVCV